MKLSPSQEKAFEALCDAKRNIFLTGGPGTGKSFLISYFLRTQAIPIPVIASTGASAILVGGRTFHSFFNLGIMQGGPEATFERAIQNSALKKRLNEITSLVMDEVSMLSGEAFDCAERIARKVRDSAEPWGGMRVIAVGDFAQLPPISRESRMKAWCFLGAAWQRSDFKKIVLTEMMRTKDEEFLHVLNDIRWGKHSERVEFFLNSRRMVDEELEENIPHIFPRRAQTDAFNQLKLSEIQQPSRIFPTVYGGNERYIERLKLEAPVPQMLELKKDAFVMIRINDPRQRFINGTTALVRDMDDDLLVLEVNGRRIEIAPFTFTILDADGKEAAFARNFPVTLAYASTIHKIQGTTLDRVHLDLTSLWEPGQAYVALSRARTGQGITLRDWDVDSIFADATVRTFYDQN